MIFKMNGIIGIVLLCSSKALASPLPTSTASTVTSPTTVTTPVPTQIPLEPAVGALVFNNQLALNNPYFNNGPAPVVPIISYSNERKLDGSYAFSFSTADGKQAEESGFVKDAFIDQAGNPQGTQVVRGSYSYVSPDGTPVEVSYVADEYGFRPIRINLTANRNVIPTLNKDKRPILNRTFDPYNNVYLYGNRFFGQYNNDRPYDRRYGYDPIKFNPYYNTYKPYQTALPTTVKPEIKKE